MEAKPIRIFIAEDSHLILAALTSMIAGVAGTEVAGSSSQAAEALLQIEKLSPDIAILDIRLKSGTGLDVLRALRIEGRTRPLVVMFSNHLPDSLRRECRALGADYVFCKANEFHQLENLMRSLAAPCGVTSAAG